MARFIPLLIALAMAIYTILPARADAFMMDMPQMSAPAMASAHAGHHAKMQRTDAVAGSKPRHERAPTTPLHCPDGEHCALCLALPPDARRTPAQPLSHHAPPPAAGTPLAMLEPAPQERPPRA